MNDALAVNNDVYAVAADVEQPACLDDLEPLVHHCSGVDGDFCTHAPVGVVERLLNGHAAKLFGGFAEEGTSRGGEYKPFERRAARHSLNALKNGGVLAVNGQQAHAVILYRVGYQVAAGNKGLLVGEGDVFFCFCCGYCRAQTYHANHRVEHHVRLRKHSRLYKALHAARNARGGVCQPEP